MLRILDDPRDIARSTESWHVARPSTGLVGGAAWIRAWLEVYGSDYLPRVAVIEEPDRTSAVIPLVRRRRRPWFLETLSVRELTEPTDFPVTDPANLRPLIEELARSRLPIRLKRLPADSPVLPQLRAVFARKALVLCRPVKGTPTIVLDDTWRAPEAHFSARRRQDFRAGRRRAERFGTVELSVEEPKLEQVDDLFDEFVAVEASGWKMRAGTALASQPRMLDFYRRFCALLADSGLLRVAFLRIDGRPVAVQLAGEYDGRYSLFKIAYDEEFARCSPGTLLMLHSVAWAAERGLLVYEFLGVEEPWTAMWPTNVRPCAEVHVYPVSPWSLPAAAEVGSEVAFRALRASFRRWRLARAAR